MQDVTDVKIYVEEVLQMNAKRIQIKWTDPRYYGTDNSGYNVALTNDLLHDINDSSGLQTVLMKAFGPVFAIGSPAITIAVRNFIDDEIEKYDFATKLKLINNGELYGVTYVGDSSSEFKFPEFPKTSQQFSQMSYDLPGVNEYSYHPVSSRKMKLRDIIISLNDNHKWTREQIADWLETLDIDITFRKDEDESTGNQV